MNMNEKWMKLDEKWMTWMQLTSNLFSVKLNSPFASFFPSHSTSAASQSQVQLETFEPFRMLHLPLQSFASIVLYLHVKRMHSCWRRTAGKEAWSLCDEFV